MTAEVLFVLTDVVDDGRGLLLVGHLRGGQLEAGDHLAPRRGGAHLHVRLAARDQAGCTTALVDATHTEALDAGSELVVVPRAAPESLLPIEGLPPVTDGAEPVPAHRSRGADEASGSGPGYDTTK